MRRLHLASGRQKKRSKDTLKKTLTSFNIDVTNCEVCAQDRPLWRSMFHAGARTAEAIRIVEAQKKARCSLSETLLSHHRLNRPDIPMPRISKSAAGPNWTDLPPPHKQGQPNMTTSSSSSKELWSSSETMDEEQLLAIYCARQQ